MKGKEKNISSESLKISYPEKKSQGFKPEERYKLEISYVYDEKEELYALNSERQDEQKVYIEEYKAFLQSKKVNGEPIDFYDLVPAFSYFNEELLKEVDSLNPKVIYQKDADFEEESLTQVVQQRVGLFLKESRKFGISESYINDAIISSIKLLIKLETVTKKGLGGQTLIKTMAGIRQDFPNEVFEYLTKEYSNAGADLSEVLEFILDDKEYKIDYKKAEIVERKIAENLSLKSLEKNKKSIQKIAKKLVEMPRKKGQDKIKEVSKKLALKAIKKLSKKSRKALSKDVIQRLQRKTELSIYNRIRLEANKQVDQKVEEVSNIARRILSVLSKKVVLHTEKEMDKYGLKLEFTREEETQRALDQMNRKILERKKYSSSINRTQKSIQKELRSVPEEIRGVVREKIKEMAKLSIKKPSPAPIARARSYNHYSFNSRYPVAITVERTETRERL